MDYIMKSDVTRISKGINFIVYDMINHNIKMDSSFMSIFLETISECATPLDQSETSFDLLLGQWDLSLFLTYHFIIKLLFMPNVDILTGKIM